MKKENMLVNCTLLLFFFFPKEQKNQPIKRHKKAENKMDGQMENKIEKKQRRMKWVLVCDEKSKLCVAFYTRRSDHDGIGYY